MAIKWKWDGKTVQLSNEEPSTYEGGQAAALGAPAVAEADLRDLTGRATTQQELKDLRKAQQAQLRDQRKQVRSFLKDLRTVGDYDMDTNAYIQEMIDSGAIRYEEDGLYVTPKMVTSERQRQAMVEAADKWADAVGLWQNGQFNPDAYQPYQTYQENQRARQ